MRCAAQFLTILTILSQNTTPEMYENIVLKLAFGLEKFESCLKRLLFWKLLSEAIHIFWSDMYDRELTYMCVHGCVFTSKLKQSTNKV